MYELIVSFTTVTGSRFHLDHTKHEFVQESPIQRVGHLHNLPQVVKGRRVEIWTDPPAGSKAAAKLIQTAAVKTREVTLE